MKRNTKKSERRWLPWESLRAEMCAKPAPTLKCIKRLPSARNSAVKSRLKVARRFYDEPRKKNWRSFTIAPRDHKRSPHRGLAPLPVARCRLDIETHKTSNKAKVFIKLFDSRARFATRIFACLRASRWYPVCPKANAKFAADYRSTSSCKSRPLIIAWNSPRDGDW